MFIHRGARAQVAALQGEKTLQARRMAERMRELAAHVEAVEAACRDRERQVDVRQTSIKPCMV